MRPRAQLTGKAKQYHDAAEKFIAAMDLRARNSLPVVSRKSANFDAWSEYFTRHLGYVPHTFRLVINDTAAEPQRFYTAPAEWPDWFDATFQPTVSRAV